MFGIFERKYVNLSVIKLFEAKSLVLEFAQWSSLIGTLPESYRKNVMEVSNLSQTQLMRNVGYV